MPDPSSAPARTAESHRLKAEGMLLLTTVIWGGTFGATKSLLAVLPPMALLTWRFGLGAIIFCLLYSRDLRASLRTGLQRRTVLYGVVLGVLLYLGFGLQTFGLKFTSSSQSGFITALYVAVTPLLQMMITRRLPPLRVALGIGIILVGLWSLTAPAGDLSTLLATSGFGGFGLGGTLTFCGAIAFATYIVVLDRIPQSAAIVQLTAVQLITTAVLCAAQSLASETWQSPHAVFDWGKLLFLSVFATVLSTYWQTSYQRDTTPTRAAVIFTLESVFAAILAVLFMGEHLGQTGVMGGTLIVAGLLTVELKRS